MTMRRILLASSVITALTPHPIRIEFMDKPKAAPSTSKRAKVKAARKQKGHKP